MGLWELASGTQVAMEYYHICIWGRKITERSLPIWGDEHPQLPAVFDPYWIDTGCYHGA